MDGKFTAFFPDDMTSDAIENESQQLLVVVKNEMEKNDFDGMQVTYINDPLPAVSSVKTESVGDVDGNDGLSTGAIFGFIIVIVVILSVVAFAVTLVIRNRREKDQELLSGQSAVSSGRGEPKSIQQSRQDDEHDSDSDSSGSSVSISSSSSEEDEEDEEVGSASVSAPSAVSGETFLTNVAQATPQETDDQTSSSEDDDSATEDESEVSLDILSHPRRDDNSGNLQPSEETSAIHGGQGVADGYDVREYSSGDYVYEEGYDSANYDRQEDSNIHGQDTEYIPHTYDSKHQSHSNDYDDEVGSITSADPPGTSYRDLPQEDDFDNSQGRFNVYENEHIDDEEDSFDYLFNHHIEDIPSLPSKSSSDSRHSFQSGNSDGHNGSNSSSHGSRGSHPSVHSSRSSRSQGQNKQGDLRYVDDGEYAKYAKDQDYGVRNQDYSDNNYVDSDGRDHTQNNLPMPPFVDDFQQHSEHFRQDSGSNNGSNTSQVSRGSRQSARSNHSSRSQGQNKQVDLRYVEGSEYVNNQEYGVRNQDYIDYNYVDSDGRDRTQNNLPMLPFVDDFQQHTEYYRQDSGSNNGSNTSQGSRGSRRSARSNRSSRSQGQNNRGDLRYADGSEYVNNQEYGVRNQDCIDGNYVDRGGHDHEQNNVPTPHFVHNFQQNNEFHPQDNEHYPQDDEHYSQEDEYYQQHAGFISNDLSHDCSGEDNIAENTQYSSSVYKSRKTTPSDDHGIIHPSFNEEGHRSSKPIPSSNTAFSTIEELDEVSHAGSAETNPRSNKSPGASVGHRERSPNHERYGEEEEGITSVFKSLSEIQTRLASKGKTALPEAAFTQHDLAARTTQTKKPYAHQQTDNVSGDEWGKEGIVEDGELL